MADRPDAIAAAVEPVLASLDLSLYDVELQGSGGARTLRVLVDRPGGVDLAAITAATEAISPILDADPAAARTLRGSYTLEVSSPGLERPLRTPAQFRGALGATVTLKVAGPDHPERLRGVLVAADEDHLEVDVDGSTVGVAVADVTSARTVFEWGSKRPEPKRTKQSKKRPQSKQKVAP